MISVLWITWKRLHVGDWRKRGKEMTERKVKLMKNEPKRRRRERKEEENKQKRRINQQIENIYNLLSVILFLWLPAQEKDLPLYWREKTRAKSAKGTQNWMFTLTELYLLQGGSNMTGTNCDLFTHNQSRSYLNHLVLSSSLSSVIRTVTVICACL